MKFMCANRNFLRTNIFLELCVCVRAREWVCALQSYLEYGDSEILAIVAAVTAAGEK